ncbi:MAG: hypothetical protein IT374_12530 [Polyangiaceae bacterium]|nr:hypothetical protein [Polyangiaceae bacterium]
MSRLALVWLATTWAPLAALVAARARRHLRAEWPRLTWALLLGVLAGAVAANLELRVWRSLSLRGLDARAPVSLLVALAFAGPLAEGVTLAAAWPATRRALQDGPLATARAAAATAGGFALSDHLVRLWRGAPASWVGHLLTTVTWVMLAGAWGYMAGRPGPGAPGRKLFPTWLAAALVRGLVAYVLAQPAALAHLAVAPLTLLLLTAGLLLRGEGARGARLRASVDEATEELARRDRPVSLPYVLVGMLANQGALLATLALALLVGGRAGVPFASIDTEGARATLPLAVLGGAGLSAFPIAGFLVTRARRAPTLAEPGLSAALAIVVTLLALGVTSRVAFVFVLTTAPVALVLACAGAWLGMGRR